MNKILLLGMTVAAMLALGAAVVTQAPAPAEPASAAPETCSLATPEYEGEATCKKCHFAQHLSWKKTKMAKTFEVLKVGQAAESKKRTGLDPAKDYTKDATCLECHTTGYGKPGGYPAVVAGKPWTAEETARAATMEGVQCESCHGPGSLTSAYKKDNEEYKKAALVPLGLVEPDAANCKTCHNAKSPTIGKVYEFDYEALVTDKSKIHKHKKLKHAH